MTEPTEVRVECPCDGTPHPDGDTVYLKDEPDVPMYVAWNVTFEGVQGSALSISEWHADMQGAFAGVYLRHGIRSWTFVDEKGDSILISPSSVNRLLPFMKGGKAVVDACDALYGTKLMAPLVEALGRTRPQRPTKKSSAAGRTGKSTPRTPNSGPRLLVPSKPSSPSDSDGRPSEVRAS